jgi:hypothetical protein
VLLNRKECDRDGPNPKSAATLTKLTSAWAMLKRGNLTVRTHLRRFTRLALGFSKKLDNLKAARLRFTSHGTISAAYMGRYARHSRDGSGTHRSHLDGRGASRQSNHCEGSLKKRGVSRQYSISI